jgi:hypothetical protein
MAAWEVLNGLGGFLVGGISTYLGLYWKTKKDLEAKYDSELRTERLKVYAALYHDGDDVGENNEAGSDMSRRIGRGKHERHLR